MMKTTLLSMALGVTLPKLRCTYMNGVELLNEDR